MLPEADYIAPACFTVVCNIILHVLHIITKELPAVGSDLTSPGLVAFRIIVGESEEISAKPVSNYQLTNITLTRPFKSTHQQDQTKPDYYKLPLINPGLIQLHKGF